MEILSRIFQKPLHMIWRIEKQERASHIVGTAHFFPYSFQRPFTHLVRSVNSVIFEGPLDEASSARIASHGRTGESLPAFVSDLNPETIREIDSLLRDRLDGQNADAWYLSLLDTRPHYFMEYTKGMQPWAAFFSIWQAYLGWEYSMDLEGYQVACRLGKRVHTLESLEEQLAVLDNIPIDRIVRQLNDVKNWKKYKSDYVRTFLEGDLEQLMALSSRFATRGPVVVGARDQIFFDRMKPILEAEDALAFVGFPHIPGLIKLFSDDGYRITQVCV